MSRARSSRDVEREFLLAFWKVHILHHAAEEPVVGQWILEELRRHGHAVSPGTLYPLLKRMQRNGWLRCETDPDTGLRGRRYYHLTPRGAAVLQVLRAAVVELHHEVVEGAAAHAQEAPQERAAIGRETPSGKTRAGTRRRAPRRS